MMWFGTIRVINDDIIADSSIYILILESQCKNNIFN